MPFNSWSIEKSSELYEIHNWSRGYFGINANGNVEVTPFGARDERRVDLLELINDLKERGLRAPYLIRFSDIIHSRINLISNSFINAFRENDYHGKYRGVFPVKVNQQKHVIEEIINYGRASHLGLEAGSKPELLIAMAMCDSPEALLICNGFKDREYIETAILSQKLGRNTVIVVDRYSELELICHAAKRLNIKPTIGFRAKLDSRGKGKWVESSGLKSKFGLTASEMVLGLDYLKKEGLLDCLKLIHFHMGSQITAMRSVKNALAEACRIFVELHQMGAPLQLIDVGGGLGVDYDGSQSNWENSMNYTVQEYANEIVYQIAAACDEANIAHPTIITESGRALVAHQSVLVFDVVGVNRIHQQTLKDADIASDDECESVSEMKRLLTEINEKNLNESIFDAFQLREDALDLFKLGYLSLRQKARLEEAYRVFCTKALKIAEPLERKPDDIDKLRRFLTDGFYGNFSIFQSAPDTWAVGQQFPLMPIHRLKEEPDARAIIFDLTCDSDGKIEKFISSKESKNALELHHFEEGSPYYIGMFLVGAYQEILGDNHNLFGDTDTVHVSISRGGYSLEHVVEGDTVTELLSYMEYDRAGLIKKMREAIELALAEGRIVLKESKLLMNIYEQGLNGYTYLEDDGVHDNQAEVFANSGPQQLDAELSM